MASETPHTTIKASNLTIGYQRKQQTTVVAENINFEAKKGEFIAVLGKNGIGKSTLLKTLTRLLPKIKGDITLNQTAISNFDDIAFAKAVSVVLTERLPQSNLTVFELIALGRQPYTNWLGALSVTDKNAINQAITDCEIEHIKHKRHDEISDGQLQKVLIARALAQDTEIIILDEPTAHLDLHNTISMFSLLKKIAKNSQKTIIISTHQVNLSLQLADALWLLSPNSFESGSPQVLAKNKAFDTLFDSKMVQYNSDLQQFVISVDD